MTHETTPCDDVIDSCTLILNLVIVEHHISHVAKDDPNFVNFRSTARRGDFSLVNNERKKQPQQNKNCINVLHFKCSYSLH